MKKNYLIAIIITVLIITGIVYKLVYQSETESVPCSEEFYEALDEVNVTFCESATEISSSKNPYYDNSCREWCIQEVAYKKEDPQLCELINNFKNITHVEGWNDPRETGSYKDHCYIQLASKLDDVSLCDNVETGWAKENCLELSKS